jgi:hypothetical protein
MSTAKEKKLYVERLRQLAQLGYAIPYEQQLNNHPSEVIVEQCAPPIDCLLFDLLDQGTIYIVWLSVTAKRPGVYLFDYRFVPPWPDQNFRTLPTTEACRGEAYVLPNNWEFTGSDVLNMRFRASGWRLECRPVEGVLCGMSTSPVPKQYKRSAGIEVGVEFFGKSGRCLAQTVTTLCLDRSCELMKISQKGIERNKADFAAQRAQRWESFLRNLTPEDAQRLGVLREPESPKLKSEPAAKSTHDPVVNRPAESLATTQADEESTQGDSLDSKL